LAHVFTIHPDGGPLQLEVSFKTKGNFNLVGKAKESKTRTAYNDIFEVNETFFEGKAQTGDNDYK
jgi:thiol:disulfide interchange protein DsbD